MRCFHLFLTCILSFAAKESGKINFSSYHVCFISPYQVSFLLDVSLSFIPIFYLPLKSEIHSSIMLLFPRIFLISSIFLLPLFVFLAHIVLFILFIFTLSFSSLCELYYKLSPLGLYTSSFFWNSFSLFWFSLVSFSSFCLLFYSFYLSFYHSFFLSFIRSIFPSFYFVRNNEGASISSLANQSQRLDNRNKQYIFIHKFSPKIFNKRQYCMTYKTPLVLFFLKNMTCIFYAKLRHLFTHVVGFQ